VTLNGTGTAGLKSGTATIALVSDGTGSSGLGLSSLPSQTVSVSGSVYRLAAASNHAPEIGQPGQCPRGWDLPIQSLSLSNTAAGDGFSEKLDASFSNPLGNVLASGSFNLLAAGATDSTSLGVTLNGTGTAGLKSGTATIALVSDGTGSSGLGLTSLPSQTVSVSGTV